MYLISVLAICDDVRDYDMAASVAAGCIAIIWSTRDSAVCA